MKCSNCGKEVNFLLAYKVSGAIGHYCSVKCAQDANMDMFTSRSDVDKKISRGGILELIVFCFLLPWWIIKLCWKMAKPIIKNKWTWTIFTCGMSWVVWKMLNALYGPKE